MVQDAVDKDAGPVPVAGGAFACPESELPPEERDRLIDSIAQRVVGRRLAVPAAFLLEAHKPLSFFGSQALLLGMPILGPFVGFTRLARFASLIESRENVEMLLRRIEELAAVTCEEGDPQLRDDAASSGRPPRAGETRACPPGGGVPTDRGADPERAPDKEGVE